MDNKRAKKGRANAADHLVARRIKERRVILGLNQQQLAKALGVSIQQIQKYEKGINRVSSGKLLTISRLLEVTMDYFFKGIEEESSDIVAMHEGMSEFEHEDGTVSKVNDREILNLVKAFSRINNQDTRKSIIDHVKMIANMLPY